MRSTLDAASKRIVALFGRFPFLRELCADGVYTGLIIRDGAARSGG
jgi:hypothetical protein